MTRIFLNGIIAVFLVFLYGCSTDTLHTESKYNDETQNEIATNEETSNSNSIETSESEITDDVGVFPNNDTPEEASESVSLEEMELLKETLRYFIFEDYMSSPDYGYAKGINWSEAFFNNLTAEEVWDLIEEYKEINNGEEGTLFDQALYLSVNAPIKDNWEELFLEEWNSGPYSDENTIETMLDKGDSVWIYTESVPYTGEEENYPIIILFKNTGHWRG
ncbi:hypothetical protein [Alkalihalobacterium elongatum]|uniref:hypothetical protein n=1 Tax=Alkalihalobacterium elongatum TaxID=2675466 RepID=UPI001C200EF5|nr:hypothetical protein [Alkalihalobacterium elongatum]